MPATTMARGKIVSKLPRGICITKLAEDGIAVISRAPRSMLRHRSSISGSSGGISRSINSQFKVRSLVRDILIISLMFVMCTNLMRCVVVVNIRCASVTRKEVQFLTSKREFAYR